MTIANIADVVSGGIDISVSGMNTVKKDASASTNKQFTDFMPQTSGRNQNENNKFAEKNTDISSDCYKYDGRKNIKEDTSNPIKEKIDSSKETIEKFEKEIVENISEDLNVETEDVEKAMEVLGLSAFDLLNPQNLADVTVEIKGLTDSSTLILDGDFQQLLSDISLVGKNLMQELNVTQDELADIVSMMDTAADMEFNTELNQEGMNIDSNIDSNIASDIDGTDNADSFFGLKDNISDDKMENDIAVAIETTEDSEQSLVNENQNNNLNDSKQNKEQFGDTLSGVFEESSSDKKDSTKINAFERTIEQSIVTNSSTNISTNQIDTLNSIDTYLSVDTMEIIEQIVEKTKVLVDSETTTMQMQLNPENLGKIYLNISSKEGSVNAQMMVTNEAVKEALEAQIVMLKENLNQAGVKVDAVEVTIASHEFERNLEQDHSREEQEGNRQEESANRRRNINLSSLDEISGVMSEEETLVAQMMKDNGNSVDLTA
ncbi:MAG: flagellar hook-length control protein FliK [Agathobacter sp.]|nr:flagellar hook-length control protein FliK [Agathobacter sp.]